MKQRYSKILILFLLVLAGSNAFAQQIKGVVTDSVTHEPLMYISVYYQEKRDMGTITNIDGEYKLETRRNGGTLVFSAVGYISKTVKVGSGNQTINIQLAPDNVVLNEVVVKPKKEKYSRKNNPAVEFMKKVIEHKKAQVLEVNDYYQYDKYEKMKMSINDLTPEKLEKGIYKKYSFLKDQVEVSETTNKLILPISVQETASQTIFRKDPQNKKTIIKGKNSNGIEEFFNTGDMLGTVLKDVFADINIYEDDIRLLQQRFVSPIGSSAISFYKYYLMDTLMVDKRECVHLTFVPQNSQDFGFTGHLYVLNDSTYAVQKCTMNLPKKTGVNFVNRMDIVQQYEQLPNGNWVLSDFLFLANIFMRMIPELFTINNSRIPRTIKRIYRTGTLSSNWVVSICSVTTPSRYTESIIACMDTDDSHILANNSNIPVNKFNIADTNATIPVLPILKRIPATDIAVKRIVSEKNN